MRGNKTKSLGGCLGLSVGKMMVMMIRRIVVPSYL